MTKRWLRLGMWAACLLAFSAGCIGLVRSPASDSPSAPWLPVEPLPAPTLTPEPGLAPTLAVTSALTGTLTAGAARPAKTPTPKPTRAPTRIPGAYDGRWVGTTSQGQALQLWIDGSTLTSLLIAFSPPVCGATLYSGSDPHPLAGNRLAYVFQVDATRLFTVEGSIDAQGILGGTIISANGEPCDGTRLTWSAHRPAP